MPQKILINGITLEEGNLVPLLAKTRYWQSKGAEISFLGNNVLKKKIENGGIPFSFKYIELRGHFKIRTKFCFIVESIRRNILCMRYIQGLKNKYDIIYSISSVLDMIVLPFVLKRLDKRIQWIAVFDNIVPFSDQGNKIIHFLAWLFFRFSLFLLKDADMIFTISQELKEFLMRKGFKNDKVVITGNGIETELIKQAKKSYRYNIDALFVGRINETKGIYDMLEVLNIVRKKYKNFQFAIMGSGDNCTEMQFKDKIKKLGLIGNIQFLGYKTGIEKFTIIKSSKSFWFLSVSDSESFGVALLEAVSCGLAAFAYDLAAYRSIYRNNEVCILKKNDYRSVARKVIELFDKGNFGNKRGEQLLGHYSWERIADIEYTTFSGS